MHNFPASRAREKTAQITTRAQTTREHRRSGRGRAFSSKIFWGVIEGNVDLSDARFLPSYLSAFGAII
jgi:hypothetical protein